MASKGFDISGIREVKRALAIDAKGVQAAADKAITNITNDIFVRADQLVPVDESPLRTSGHIQVSRTSTGIELSIVYGGASAPYAIVQHENLDFWHPPKPPSKSKVGGRQGSGPGPDPQTGRGAKYLERPFLEQTKNLRQKIVAQIRAEFFGG